MSMLQIWCIVPVNLLALAKQRLSPLLSVTERRDLALVMMRDVLESATATPGLAGVAVVTSDPLVAETARNLGALVLPDSANSGLNAALAAGRQRLIAEQGAGGLIVLPADIPLVRPDDIAALLTLVSGTPSVVIANAAADGGSNALALSPADAIPFCYGVDSARRHAEAAACCGLAVLWADLPHLALDIDRPDDLFTLLQSPIRSRSRDFLVSLGRFIEHANGHASLPRRVSP